MTAPVSIASRWSRNPCSSSASNTRRGRSGSGSGSANSELGGRVSGLRRLDGSAPDGLRRWLVLSAWACLRHEHNVAVTLIGMPVEHEASERFAGRVLHLPPVEATRVRVHAAVLLL